MVNFLNKRWVLNKGLSIIFFIIFWLPIVYATISWPLTPDWETAWWSIGAMMNAITIDSWNVGIGKTPITELDVNGAITATNITWILSTATQTNITSLWTLTSLNITGNVGIWTTTPWTQLHIYNSSQSATSKIESDWSWMDAQLTLDSGWTAGWWFPRLHFDMQSVNKWQIWVSTSERLEIAAWWIAAPSDANTKMVILQSGNVGIGTTTPWVDLDVADSDLSHVRAIITNQTNNPSIYMLADEANNKWWLYTTAPNLELGANNSIHMTVDSSGNVGIGTMTPSNKFHVNWWALYVRNTQYLAWFVWDYWALNLKSENEGGINWLTMFPNASNQNYRFQMYSWGSEIDTLVIRWETWNVGIGTSAPDNKLEIKGSWSTTWDARYLLHIKDDTLVSTGAWGWIVFSARYTDTPNYSGYAAIQWERENSNGSNSAWALTLFSRPNGGDITERMRIDSSGNVGIGTTSPQWDLDLYDSGSDYSFTRYSNLTTGTNQWGDGFYVGLYSDESGYIWQAENTHIRFGTSNSERVRITSAGNVGIGTTEPIDPLHVSWYIRGTSWLKIGSSSSTITFTYMTSNSADSCDYSCWPWYNQNGVCLAAWKTTDKTIVACSTRWFQFKCLCAFYN